MEIYTPLMHLLFDNNNNNKNNNRKIIFDSFVNFFRKKFFVQKKDRTAEGSAKQEMVKFAEGNTFRPQRRPCPAITSLRSV